MIVTIPVRIVSAGNISEHWRDRRKREKIIAGYVKLYMRPVISEGDVPCTVRLTRVAPRPLDGDNLQFALKNVRDTLADLLIPGLAKGQADGDPRIKWEYSQEKGKPKEYSLKIQVRREG